MSQRRVPASTLLANHNKRLQYKGADHQTPVVLCGNVWLWCPFSTSLFCCSFSSFSSCCFSSSSCFLILWLTSKRPSRLCIKGPSITCMMWHRVFEYTENQKTRGKSLGLFCWKAHTPGSFLEGKGRQFDRYNTKTIQLLRLSTTVGTEPEHWASSEPLCFWLLLNLTRATVCLATADPHLSHCVS